MNPSTARHQGVWGGLLEYRGDPGRLRSLTRAPRPDILQRLDVRLPHQKAVSYASPDVRARDMAIVPGTRTGCPYGVATSRPHGGANRAGAMWGSSWTLAR